MLDEPHRRGQRVLHPARGARAGGRRPADRRAIWFSRLDLSVARQLIYDDDGNILSDARYTRLALFRFRALSQGTSKSTAPRTNTASSSTSRRWISTRAWPDDKFVLEPAARLHAPGDRRAPPRRRPRASRQKEEERTVTVKLVLENLKHKPVRSLLSILLIGVPVTLILCLVGLSHGMMEDSQRRARGIGADIIVRPPRHLGVTLSGAPFPKSWSDAIEQTAARRAGHRLIVHPVDQRHFGQWDRSGTFNRMSGGFKFSRGRAVPAARRHHGRRVLRAAATSCTPATTSTC